MMMSGCSDRVGGARSSWAAAAGKTRVEQTRRRPVRGRLATHVDLRLRGSRRHAGGVVRRCGRTQQQVVPVDAAGRRR